MGFVTTRFKVADPIIREIKDMQPNFGFNGFGELVFYRTYSRPKNDGTMESWNDVIIRATEGVFSIRKDWYTRNYIPWNEDFWQHYARNFAISMFNMEWLPPGRGLWAMGSDYVFERGSMALQNCGLTKIGENLGDDIHWMMDALMNGVGVGFVPERDFDLVASEPKPHETLQYLIEDSREGWCDSVKILIDSYLLSDYPTVIFNYDKIRSEGELIRGFGGLASGPDPLKKLHERIRNFFNKFIYEPFYDSVILKTDIANAVGCCVVAGNVRRSAELAAAPIDDPIFMDLKNYKLYPERAEYGWMSNNSVLLEKDEDFERLGEVARRVLDIGEPGCINLKNLRFGRIGHNDGLREDKAIGFNPCGEQPLEDKELCTLVETFPTRCKDFKDWRKALEYATMYASTVTLLPTHRQETNSVMLRNRRIGVSIADFTGWQHLVGTNKITKYLREGYKIVTRINQWANSEAGIPEAIRKTTIKPGGTVPKLAGVTAGCSYPSFIYTLRRVRIAKNIPLAQILKDANIPYEDDYYSDNTYVFEFPIKQGPAKPADRVSLREQAMNLVMLQREWSDNAVSNTLYFKPGVEDDDIESVLAMIMPHVKSVSLLPHSSQGAYIQMPEEGITSEQYVERLNSIKPINWSELRNNIPNPEKYCTGDACEVL